LNIPIACRRYGSGKPSTLPSIEGGFTPTTSMVVLGEKLGMDLRIGQLACCELGQEPFSREQWLCSSLLTTSQKVDVSDMLVGFSLQGVHRFESPRLSDMSKRLSYGCHQVVN
jgi:hypothetical protein